MFRSARRLYGSATQSYLAIVQPQHPINRVTTLTCSSLRHLSTSQCRNNSNFEPPYLIDAEPSASTYPLINIQMNGYDYTVLQGYQGWVTRAVRLMGLHVSDGWASPSKKLEITSLKDKTDVVEEKFHLNVYQRTVQVKELPSTVVPVLLETLQAALPEGVDLYVDHHNPETDLVRFIPNKELNELRQELENVDNPTATNKFSRKLKK